MRRVKILKISAALVGICLLLGLAGVNYAQASIIAYDVVVQTGNQTYTKTMGMDFDVNTPIWVNALGVFDSDADGLHGPLYAAIYDRDTTNVVIAPIAFSSADPGDLIGGSRFKNLDSEIQLAEGHYTIVSWGYSSYDPNGNTYGTDLPYPITVSTLNDGGGAISFVGSSRYSQVAIEYPTKVDGGPVNRYLAGTFAYNTSPDPAPLPPAALLLGSGLLGLGLLRHWAWHPKK
jgi:hypothetical protein